VTLAGGEYNFTSIDIPQGVTVTVSGNNTPLEMLSLGPVSIVGDIVVVSGTTGLYSNLGNVVPWNDNCEPLAGGGFAQPGGPAGTGGPSYWAMSSGLPVGGTTGKGYNWNGFAAGGAGGGVLRIVGPSIVLDGELHVDGGDGTFKCQNSGCTWGFIALTGGGSGGHVWLQTSSLSGSGLVSANGGVGGSYAATCGALVGGEGSEGYVRVEATANTFSGSSTPSALVSPFVDGNASSGGLAVSQTSAGEVSVFNGRAQSAIVAIVVSK